ncbi:LysR family transcriptional regulator [Pseudomonas sp. AS2.8]|uniref:LysR family transcriptional regulator n=1 Tax=Pseudomonas sp. AS2.8 TaxID=2587128 RepID=UPI00160D463B|nr:LysR family transcriptional regulator [Pseudomonas sp. AS2.8]MBB2895031.1 DNA-binding transcriptional LysR family regulator [Pseudomonas sp. AS2.8]
MLPSLGSIASRLRLRQLRLLIALDEEGSLHKAAERIAISQPGATKALHEIESTLGATLFLRTHQGLQPNDLGRCVIRYARLIESDLAHLREEMLGILQGEGGRLAVGVIMGAVPRLIAAVSRLGAAQPQLGIEIIEDTSVRLLDLLDAGRIEVAICRSSVSRRPDAYDCLEVREERLEIVCHPRHPLAESETLGLAELVDSRWIVYPANLPMRLTLEREFRAAELEFPRYPVETSSTFTLLGLLQEDANQVAMLPSDIAQFGERHGLLRRLPVVQRTRNEPYSILVRQGAGLSAAAQLLLEQWRLAG